MLPASKEFVSAQSKMANRGSIGPILHMLVSSSLKKTSKNINNPAVRHVCDLNALHFIDGMPEKSNTPDRVYRPQIKL